MILDCSYWVFIHIYWINELWGTATFNFYYLNLYLPAPCCLGRRPHLIRNDKLTLSRPDFFFIFDSALSQKIDIEDKKATFTLTTPTFDSKKPRYELVVFWTSADSHRLAGRCPGNTLPPSPCPRGPALPFPPFFY